VIRDRTGTGLSLERRLQLLELDCAKLAEELWWHQLPWPRRFYYFCQGYRSPIRRFFQEVEDEIDARAYERDLMPFYQRWFYEWRQRERTLE
jgi:hypothetical protein